MWRSLEVCERHVCVSLCCESAEMGRGGTAWLVAALVLLTLQHFVLPPVVPSSRAAPPSVDAAVPSACDESEDDEFCPVCLDAQCCSNLSARRLSLLVLLRKNNVQDWPTKAVFDSWLQSDAEVIIVVPGNCGGAPAFITAAENNVRLLCLPGETRWRDAQLRNLAAQLATGQLLLIATATTTRAVVNGLLAAADERPAACLWPSSPIGSFALRSRCWRALRGWDERIPSLPERVVATGESALDAADADLWARAAQLDSASDFPHSDGALPASVRHVVRAADGRPPPPPPLLPRLSAHDHVAAEEDAENVAAAGVLLRRWHEAGLSPTRWQVAAAHASPHWCTVQARTPAPPDATTLLPNASEHLRTTLRLAIFRTSGRSVPWPVLQRMRSLRELQAAWELHQLAAGTTPSAASAASAAGGVGRVLLVQAQNTLPRRLLAVCSAAAIASEWKLPLAIAWSADVHLRTGWADLFQPAAAGTPLAGALHLRNFVEGMAPAELFERWEPPGDESARRAQRVRRPTGARAVYIRAAGPIEASPATDPDAVRACLRSLQPTADASALVQRTLQAHATASSLRNMDDVLGDGRPRALGVHLCMRVSGSEGAGGGDPEASDADARETPPAESAADEPYGPAGRTVSDASPTLPSNVRCTATARSVRRHAVSCCSGAGHAAAQLLVATSECPLDTLTSLTRTLLSARVGPNDGTDGDGSSTSNAAVADASDGNDDSMSHRSAATTVDVRHIATCRNCSLAQERLRACSGGHSPASSSRACSVVVLAEWQLLSYHAAALMLTTGSHFSRLVATTAAEATRVDVGCRTGGAQWPPRPWTLWPAQPPATLLTDSQDATPGAAVLAVPIVAAGRWTHFVVNDAARLVFCWMPKVACTSWKMWLRTLAGEVAPRDPTRVHGRANGLRDLTHVPPAERGAVLTNYTKVVFVRDPWSRALSAYLNKFVEEPHARRRAWLRELLRPLRAMRPGSALLRLLSNSGEGEGAASLSFETFVGVLEETQRAVAARKAHAGGAAVRLTVPNEHWASQSELCGLHALRYDFVGRHEDLRRDALALGSLLRLDATPPSGASYGWEGNRNASRLLARHFRSRALVRRVANIYRDDVNAPLNGVAFSAQLVFGDSFPRA